MRVLVVEDEALLLEQLCTLIERLNWRAQPTQDGQDALFLAREYPFDLALIDLGLPGLSGLEVIRRLRREGKALPVLILTARDRWQDKVEGLEAGADDYLAKPFQPEELVARLRALARRAAGALPNQIRCGPLVLDPLAGEVHLSGHPLTLTTFEFRLLEFLMTHRQRVVSKDELAAYLYPLDEERESNTVEVLLGRVRRKIDPDGSLAPIETLRGRGYRFRLCAG